MKNTASTVLLSIVVASTLVACTTTPRPKDDTQITCWETGLTDAADSKLGQRECGPVKSRTRPAK